jgi:hypothetical protein
MKSFEELQETMDLLNELVTNQSKALTLSKEIINNKSRIIEICENQTAYYKKLSIRQFKCNIVLSIIIIVSVIIQSIFLIF